jgi:hypothetical protein
LTIGLSLAEWPREEVSEPVPHRRVVITIPRMLRGLRRSMRRKLVRDSHDPSWEPFGFRPPASADASATAGLCARDVRVRGSRLLGFEMRKDSCR